MLGNDIAIMSLQVKSVDSLEKSMSRTIGPDKLAVSILRSSANTAPAQIDTLVRALYSLSTNTYNSTTIIGKSDLTEIIAG